jgi:hypothetical protein
VLDGKLQIKPGQTVAVVDAPVPVALAAAAAPVREADAVLLFARTRAELLAHVPAAREAAARGALTWLVYPKARQLGTDLTRDVLRADVAGHGLDTVRQVSVDDTWSALRVKATG